MCASSHVPRTRVTQFGRPSEEKVPRTRVTLRPTIREKGSVTQFGRPSEEKVPRTRVSADLPFLDTLGVSHRMHALKFVRASRRRIRVRDAPAGRGRRAARIASHRAHGCDESWYARDASQTSSYILSPSVACTRSSSSAPALALLFLLPLLFVLPLLPSSCAVHHGSQMSNLHGG